MDYEDDIEYDFAPHELIMENPIKKVRKSQTKPKESSVEPNKVFQFLSKRCIFIFKIFTHFILKKVWCLNWARLSKRRQGSCPVWRWILSSRRSSDMWRWEGCRSFYWIWRRRIRVPSRNASLHWASFSRKGFVVFNLQRILFDSLRKT